MSSRFGYTRVSNPLAPTLAKFKYHPLLKIGLMKGSALVRTDAYIDTGSQWCLFNNDFAKQLGIKDVKDTKDIIQLSGVGGKKPENIGYFHNLRLIVFKDDRNLHLKNSWQVDTLIGFLEKPIGFSGILGVAGFLDQFSLYTNIPQGYFEIEPLFDVKANQ